MTDVFISYSSHDQAWVRGILLPALEIEGFSALIDYRDFRRGAPSLLECERAVGICRRTVAVLTPDYLESAWCTFESVLLQSSDPANSRGRLLPVLRKSCDIPSRLKSLTYIDFRDDNNVALAWQQLFEGLRDTTADALVTMSLPPYRRASLSTLPSTHRRNLHFVPNPVAWDGLTNLKAGSFIALSGMGGIGKTQHIVQHTHDNARRYSYILWLAAGTVTQLRSGFASTGALLREADAAAASTSTVDGATYFRKWMETASQWLLIVDGADSREVVQELELTLPPRHGGHVVVTTRLTEWPPAYENYQLGVWSPSEYTAFIRRRIGNPRLDPADAEQLGRSVGGLPLALEQACAYIRRAKCSVSTYTSGLY